MTDEQERPLVIIRPAPEMEMPADCFGCRETFELNDMWSCSDGAVRCRECHRSWIEDGEGDDV